MVASEGDQGGWLEDWLEDWLEGGQGEVVRERLSGRVVRKDSGRVVRVRGLVLVVCRGEWSVMGS